MDYYEKKFEESNHFILDVFSGADNSTFANYLFGMRDLAQKADNGDQAAQQLCKVVDNMKNLLVVLSK